MSLRKAINDKCRDCCYDPLAGGTWRQQVGECAAESCPLWHVRPMPSAMRTEEQRQRDAA